jgi:hypothetical protein
MSRYGLWLEGWDHSSIWGYDPPLETFYAQLTRDGTSDDDGPEIWITPPTYPDVRSAGDLALLIAKATGAGLAAGRTAMDPGLRNAGDPEQWLHSPTPLPRPAAPTKTAARLLRLRRGRGGVERGWPGG